MSAAKKTLVIRNGTLIDGSGKPAQRNDAIVIEGNRIKSVGALPPTFTLDDRRNVEVIDAAGQWIMPGLIDAHCHVSYGYPIVKGEGKGRGTTRPEFSTLKSARSVQKVLRCGRHQHLGAGRHLVHRCRRARRHQARPDGRPAHVRRRPHDRHLRLHRGRRAVVGRHARSLDRQAVQHRRRDGHRGAPPRQARRQFHQDGRQPLRRIADAGEGGNRRRGRRGAPPQPAGRHPLARRRLDPRRRRSRRRLDHPRRSRHRPRSRSGRQGRHADPADRDVPCRGGRARQAAKGRRRAGAARLQPHEAALRSARRTDAQGAQARHPAFGRHRHRQQFVHAPRRTARQGAGDLRQTRRLLADGGDRGGDARQRLRGRA